MCVREGEVYESRRESVLLEEFRDRRDGGDVGLVIV